MNFLKLVTLKNLFMLSTYPSQFIKASKKLIKGHHKLLSRALRRQTGEALNVCKQDTVARTDRRQTEKIRSIITKHLVWVTEVSLMG